MRLPPFGLTTLVIVGGLLLSQVAAGSQDAAAQPAAAQPPAGQPALTPTPPPASRTAASQEDAVGRGIAARAVARMATSDLKLQSDPAQQRSQTERDFRITAELLQVAANTDPGDEDILRLLIQAWTAAGDADRVETLQRQLAKLDTRDTVTLLAVVSSRISRLQNVDERLAAYNKLLGPEGDRLDPSIRSRLALDAALLMRERGDDQGFAKLLARSSALDSTNKDAATLALAYFAERVPDAAGRLELLINVLKSDPFDPDVHAAIAQELASAGAIKGAERFYQTLSALRRARQQELQPQEYSESIVSGWNINGAMELVTRMNAEIEDQREQLRARKAKLEAEGQLMEQVSDPSDARLPIPLERIRIVASAATGDPELIGYAAVETAETIRRSVEVVADPQQRPEGMTDEQAVELLRSLRIERVWLSLWAGRHTDEVPGLLEELRADPAVDALVLKRLDAWATMRRGDLTSAASQLGELAKEDPLAMMGLGVLAELQGQHAAAAKVYESLTRTLAGSIAGAFCRTRHIDIMGKEPQPTELARRMQQLVDEVPTTVEAMISDPRRFMDLRVEAVQPEMGLTDKVTLRFTLQNTSPYAMAVGPERPINTRFLIAPMVDMGVQRLKVPNLQEILSLDRRLRLQPGEKFEVEVWADAGLLGALLQRIASVPARIRWRVVQGFRINKMSYFDPGPLCLTTEAGPVTRPVSFRASADIPSFVGWIEKGTSRELAEALLALREKLGDKSLAAGVSLPDVELVVRAAVNRFRSGGRAEKLIILAYCPTGAQVPQFAPLDIEAMSDPDEDIVRYMVALRIPTADAPQLAPDAWTSRPAIGELARIVRERLAEGVKTMANIGIRDLAAETPTPEEAPAGGR